MYAENFATRLKEARKKTGFTQKEVAKELNMNHSTLAGYEIGRTQPDFETLGRLANFYNVSTDWLLSLGREKKD